MRARARISVVNAQRQHRLAVAQQNYQGTSASPYLLRSMTLRQHSAKKCSSSYFRLSKKLYVLKFIYSEKTTKFCEISTVDLSYVVPVKSTVEISQNFVAFSDYMNFTQSIRGEDEQFQNRFGVRLLSSK